MFNVELFIHRMLILSIAYVANLIFNVLGLKAISYYYEVKHILFATILYGHLFPVLLCYFFYQQTILYHVDFLIGFLDYVQLICVSVGISGVNVAQYLSLRNVSFLINVVFSYLLLDKTFDRYQQVGTTIIGVSCGVVFYMGGMQELFYSVMIFIYSLLYSLIGTIMEMNKEKGNIIHVKCVSSFFHISTYFFYSLFNNSLYEEFSSKHSVGLFLLIISVMGSEYLFYILKKRLVEEVENGSIYTNFLDIVRRILTLVSGVFIFNESNPSYLYIFYGVMMIGCVLFYFNKEIKERLQPSVELITF